jgi:hypothetical protein
MRRSVRNGLAIAGMAGGMVFLGQAVASADDTAATAATAQTNTTSAPAVAIGENYADGTGGDADAEGASVDNSDGTAQADGGIAAAGNAVVNDVDADDSTNSTVVLPNQASSSASADGGTATVSPTTTANTTGGSADGTGGSIDSANGANSGNNTNSGAGTGTGTGTPGVISNVGSNGSHHGGNGGTGGTGGNGGTGGGTQGGGSTTGHQHDGRDCPDASHHEAATPAHHAKPAAMAPAAMAPAALKAPVSRTAQPKGELAFTGSDVSVPLTLGLVALGAGAALSLAGRRRETTTA